MPPEVWTDELLLQSARLLRAFHDATVGFPRHGAVWQQPSRRPAEVVCHNHFVRYNFVLVDGRILRVMDVGMASPGPARQGSRPPRLPSRAAVGTRQHGPPLVRAAGAAAAPRPLVAASDGPRVERVLGLVVPLLDDAAVFAEGRGGRFLDHARAYRADAAWVAAHRAALSS
jgi:hypothetical protein